MLIFALLSALPKASGIVAMRLVVIRLVLWAIERNRFPIFCIREQIRLLPKVGLLCGHDVCHKTDIRMIQRDSFETALLLKKQVHRWIYAYPYTHKRYIYFERR